MGIEQSYKAFFGFELSSTGKRWNSRACISFQKERHHDCEDSASGNTNVFRKQLKAYQAQKESHHSAASADHIQDAEFEMIADDFEIRENVQQVAKSKRKETVSAHISRRVETYLQYQKTRQKGTVLDYRF